MQTQPMLYLRRVIRTEDRRSMHDRRVIVVWTLAEYRDRQGNEYRKSFEARKTEPTIPQEGTTAQLHALSKQW